MPRRLPILVVLVCLVCAGAGAESISLQSSPNLLLKGRANRSISEFETLSPGVVGDLGRGFNNEYRSPIRTSSNELGLYRIPRGSLVTSVNRHLNFGFYRSSQFVTSGTDPFTDLIMQTLFDRKPKGPRGRRELAQTNSR